MNFCNFHSVTDFFFQKFREIKRYNRTQCSVEKSAKTRSQFLCKNRHFFRQLNVFSKEVTKSLISRKNFERDRGFIVG